MMRFARGKFATQYSPTIGIDFQLKNATIEGKKVTIQVIYLRRVIYLDTIEIFFILRFGILQDKNDFGL